MHFDPESQAKLIREQLPVIERTLRAGGRLVVRDGLLDDLENWLMANGDTPNTHAFELAARLWVLLQPPRAPHELLAFILTIPDDRWGLFAGMSLPDDKTALDAGLSFDDRVILLRARVSQTPAGERLAYLHELAESAPELLHQEQGISDAEIRGIAREKHIPLENWPAVLRDQVWRATRADCWAMKGNGRFPRGAMPYDVPGWFTRLNKTAPAERRSDWEEALRALLVVANVKELADFLPGMRVAPRMLVNLYRLCELPAEKRNILEQLISEKFSTKIKASALHSMVKGRPSLAARVYPLLSPDQGLSIVLLDRVPDVPPELARQWVLAGNLTADTTHGFLHLVAKHDLYELARHQLASSLIPVKAVRAAGINLRQAACQPLLYRCVTHCLQGVSEGDQSIWPDWYFIMAQNPKSEAWSTIDHRFPGLLAMMLDLYTTTLSDNSRIRGSLQLLEHTPDMEFLAFLADVAVPGDAMDRYRTACQENPQADRLQMFQETLLGGLRQEMRGVEMIAPQMSPPEKAAIWASMVERVRQAAIELSPATSRCASAL